MPPERFSCVTHRLAPPHQPTCTHVLPEVCTAHGACSSISISTASVVLPEPAAPKASRWFPSRHSLRAAACSATNCRPFDGSSVPAACAARISSTTGSEARWSSASFTAVVKNALFGSTAAISKSMPIAAVVGVTCAIAISRAPHHLCRTGSEFRSAFVSTHYG